MLRFTLGNGQRLPASLDGAHLVGTDGVPVRAEIQVVDNEIRCKPRSNDPTALSLLWQVGDVGSFQLETTRLPQREKPYNLLLELARHRLMRINTKREEWGLFDYPGMESFAKPIDAARQTFIEALKLADDPKACTDKSATALEEAVRASEDMCNFHASVFLKRRQDTGGFNGRFFGAALPSLKPDEKLRAFLKESCDFVTVPLVWRDIQPKEAATSYEAVDACIDAMLADGLAVTAGPLLNFGVRFVPDWMYIWENDFETIFEYAQQYLQQTISRYANKVSTWLIGGGLHGDNALAFSFEQIMELTRMASSVARSAAPRAKVLIDITQPWGEYYARNQQTIPPLLYADMIVQGAIPVDGFGLQFLFGVKSDGYHLRDHLQISSLIDRLANFGKPIHVSALGVPSSPAQSDAGHWHSNWTDQNQAEWLESVCELVLSKPYVETVCVREFFDNSGGIVPTSGLIAKDYKPRPAYDVLKQLRTRLRMPPES